MYYELINEVWKPNHSKSVFFDGDTRPIAKLPPEFWNDERKLVAPVIIPEPPTPKELGQQLNAKRSMMNVTPWKFRKALNSEGHRNTVEGAISQADQDTRDGWEYATSFDRLDPLVVSLAGELGFTDEYIDELFELAGTL